MFFLTKISFLVVFLDIFLVVTFPPGSQERLLRRGFAPGGDRWSQGHLAGGRGALETDVGLKRWGWLRVEIEMYLKSSKYYLLIIRYILVCSVLTFGF